MTHPVRPADGARAVSMGVHPLAHGGSAPVPVIVDLDATLVGSRLEKGRAAPAYHKKGLGFHPL